MRTCVWLGLLALLLLPSSAAADGWTWDGVVTKSYLSQRPSVALSPDHMTVIYGEFYSSDQDPAPDYMTLCCFNLRFINAGTGSLHLEAELRGFESIPWESRYSSQTLQGNCCRPGEVGTGAGAFSAPTPIELPYLTPLTGQLIITIDGVPHVYDLGLVQPIPEPATLVLVGSGLIGLGAWWRKRKP